MKIYKRGGEKMKKKIIVIVDGGIVQDVQGIPKRAVIEVHDYDVDGATPEDIDPICGKDERLRRDKDGNVYHLSSWLKGQ